MKIIVLGAGIIGISTAWHLRERGHEVTVIERQPAASLETTFANAGQISVSYCEPWANAEAPLKVLKWMTKPDAPLLFRPQWPVGEGLQQWLWGLRFLGQCNDAAFERNVSQLVALGAYSHAALKDIVNATGIEYHRLERGIAHYYTDAASFDTAGAATACRAAWSAATNCSRSNPPSSHLPTASSAAPSPTPTRAATHACSPKVWPACANSVAWSSCTAMPCNSWTCRTTGPARCAWPRWTRQPAPAARPAI